ncbi:hypothetical protein FRC01_012456 [Tulasnella sp. 417]|nr:hypothetical protein FRC01_012456 [Tulasnella sp. 417]
MFTQIPVEIIHLIVESVDLLQRARIMMTCCYFRQVLEPTLYRHLSLLNPECYSRSSRLHQTLHDRPALLSQIVTYRGPIFPHMDDVSDEGSDAELPRKRRMYEDPRLYVSLTIFEGAVNIRDLEFTDYFERWTVNFIWKSQKEAISRMVLDQLVMDVPNESFDVVQVLRNQPELTRLELPWPGGGGGWKNLEAKDIPKLKSLSAKLEIAALIVPGRPVDEVNLLSSEGGRRLDEDLLQRLSESTRPIRKFGTKLYIPFHEESVRGVLKTLSRYLPDLEALTISVKGKISGRMLLSELPAFPSIVSLTLLGASLVNTLSSTTPEELSPLVNPLLPNNTDNPDSWADLEYHLRKRCPKFTTLGRSTTVNNLD